VNGEDFQFEEVVISKAVGLSFHGLDFVVRPFQRSGGDRVVVPSQNSSPVILQCPSKPLKYADAGLIYAVGRNGKP